MTPTIDSFVQALKEQIATPKADIEKNIRALLSEMVSKMDLVSQQELDRQKIALEQANQKLTTMQIQLTMLEERLNTIK